MAISGWNLYIVCFSKPLFRFDPFAFAKVQLPIQNFHGIKPLGYLFHVSYRHLYGLLAQRDGKLKRGKKKKTMKNEFLNITANKKSKSASMPGLDTVQFFNNEDVDFMLSPRERLYNKSIEQLFEMLKISQANYLPDAFSKEQLVEFILTPLD